MHEFMLRQSMGSRGHAVDDGMHRSRRRSSPRPRARLRRHEIAKARYCYRTKGRYRDAELTAREAPTGTLNIASMPKRKNAASTAAQTEAMNAWMKKTYSGKVSRCVLELCARFDRACTD